MTAQKKCPNCGQDILISALRCRYCRKAVHQTESFSENLTSSAGKIFSFGSFAQSQATWGIVSVILFSLATWGLIWLFGYYDAALLAMDWLRARYILFVREPLLGQCVYLFLDTFILKLLLVFFILLFLWARGQRAMTALALDIKEDVSWRKFSLVFTCASCALGWFEGLDPLVPSLPTPLFFTESSLISNPIAIFSMVIVAPIMEEIVFRGFAYPAFQKKWGAGASILITSVLFAAIHAPQLRDNYSSLAVVFVSGFFITVARAKTGSTRYSIFLHAIYNGMIVIAGLTHYAFFGF